MTARPADRAMGESCVFTAWGCLISGAIDGLGTCTGLIR
jgi:hypothetical protein